MAPGPPQVIELLVEMLLPPPYREHVIGDLRERYRSRRQYVADACSVVPRLIWSQIRRTTDPQVVLMEAFALYISYLIGLWLLHEMAFLREQRGFVKLTIPVLSALVALVLVNVYSSAQNRSRMKPIYETGVGVLFGFLSQAILWIFHSRWQVPMVILLFGSSVSLILVSGLRFLFPPGGNRPTRVS